MDWQEIDNRLVSRGVRRECPMCDSPDWNAGTRGVLLITFEEGQAHIDSEANSAEGLECATVTCANCGFVRLHALHTLGEAENSIGESGH